MQLTKSNLISQLTIASMTCLGASGAVQAEWEVDSAVLIYDEQDRVSAVEPAISLKKTQEDGSVIGVKVVVDALTGASPNGATASDQPQTFTRPSGKGSYTTPAGEIPLDDTFKDTRAQVSASYDAPLASGDRYNLGLSVSSEYDFTSLSLNGGMTHYFNQKNTTLNWGVSLTQDMIRPVGGAPIGSSDISLQRKDGDEQRTTAEARVGISQVLDKRSLIQASVGLASSSGYHTDPYKFVSQLDDNGRPVAYFYENRPDNRLKTYLHTNYRRHLSWGDTFDASYRLTSDDWGITSHTVETKYRWNWNEKFSLTPKVRYYQQTAADFYQHHLDESPEFGDHLSSDSRLSELSAFTVGAKLAYRTESGSEFSLRLEQYEQSSDDKHALLGVQESLPQSSDLSATIVQFGYKFTF